MLLRQAKPARAQPVLELLPCLLGCTLAAASKEAHWALHTAEHCQWLPACAKGPDHLAEQPVQASCLCTAARVIGIGLSIVEDGSPGAVRLALSPRFQ